MTRGLTLIEVLVAMLVTSLLTAALASSARAFLFHRLRSDQLLTAHWIAERSLEEMLARDAATLRAESLTDEVGEPLGRFLRNRLIEAGPRENLWHLRVQVRAVDGGRDVVLHTLVRASYR